MTSSDRRVVERSLAGAERVYHLAGQVAVTRSIVDPRGDFQANALGTFNVLEAARLVGDDPVVIYASTNKVYGEATGMGLVERTTRWHDAARPLGVPETAPVDPHSPYGCSKAAGDQYTRDYHRIYGLRTVVMRQSCIIGPRQIGIEDQGWVAWLIIAALSGHPITVFGDGKQVRDVLAVDDLLDAYDAVVDRIDATAGEVFNVGGGPANTISMWAEFGPSSRCSSATTSRWSGVRRGRGDQRWYVSDISKLTDVVGWRPSTDVRRAITTLHDWLRAELGVHERTTAEMRIVLAMTYYRPYVSGPIVYADNLAAELRRRGHEITILTARYEPGCLERSSSRAYGSCACRCWPGSPRAS